MFPAGELAWNPGMCPDWESHWPPFGSQASAQSTKPHQPGLFIYSLTSLYNIYCYHVWIFHVFHTIISYFYAIINNTVFSFHFSIVSHDWYGSVVWSVIPYTTKCLCFNSWSRHILSCKFELCMEGNQSMFLTSIFLPLSSFLSF